MKMNFIKRLIFGLAFILLASVASAKELKSDELNYIFTVPDGWTVTFQNSVGFSVASPDGNKTMGLLVRNINFATLDSNSIAAIYETFPLKTGTEKISSRNFTIDGIPAYETVQRIGKVPYATTFIFRIIIANHKFYHLSAMHGGGDVTQDAEMLEGLASFHFLQPPKPSRFNFLGVKLTVAGIIIIGIVFWVIRSRKI
jgi:hypothetical protein